MKRIVSLVLVLCLALCLTPALAAEEEDVFFEAGFLNAVDRTQSGWYGTASGRALFTVLIALDYMAGIENPETPNIFRDSYVYTDDNGYVALICPAGDNNEHTIFLYFHPGYFTGFYSLVEDTDAAEYAPGFLKFCGYSYKKNDYEDVNDAFEEIKALFESSN